MSQDQLPLPNEIVFPAQVVHAKWRYGSRIKKESPYVLRLRHNSGGGRSCVLDGKEYSTDNCHGDFYTFIGSTLEVLRFQDFCEKNDDIGIECIDFYSDGESALIVNHGDLTAASNLDAQKILEWAIDHGGVPNYEAAR